jgi:peptidoglycan hydrolase-like protein with peptidoglycan-binding domain
MKRIILSFALLVSTVALLCPTVASATASIQLSASLAPAISAQMPLLRLTSNHPISAHELPRLIVTPSLKTVWRQAGPMTVDAYVTSPISPSTLYKIDVPSALGCSTTCTFAQEDISSIQSTPNLTWADQILASLNFLPVGFTQQSTGSLTNGEQSGNFSWRYPNLPTTLSSQWQVGVNTPLLKGAIMNFQAQHSLPTTGLIDDTTWSTMLTAESSTTLNTQTYNYVSVSMKLPETLTLYVNGVATFHSLVNTGISLAPTSIGTYPVYLRYTSTTMKGTNPDGSTYDDPDIQWVSYFNGGEGLHEFPRSTYGWPQSLGCVEMPMASAAYVWPFTPIGTLVTVHA